MTILPADLIDAGTLAAKAASTAADAVGVLVLELLPPPQAAKVIASAAAPTRPSTARRPVWTNIDIVIPSLDVANITLASAPDVGAGRRGLLPDRRPLTNLFKRVPTSFPQVSLD